LFPHRQIIATPFPTCTYCNQIKFYTYLGR
jgi:hypothetical protein